MALNIDVRVKFGVFLLNIATLGVGGCKKKNSGDSGLLDEPAKTDPSVPDSEDNTHLGGQPPSSGSTWVVTCKPSENPLDPRTYSIEITGAISETNENQAIRINITKSIDAPNKPEKPASHIIASSEIGRGSIAPLGNIFFGFAGGALTGQYEATTKKHEGLLTLVNDQDVSGLGVHCDVIGKDATPAPAPAPAPAPTNAP